MCDFVCVMSGIFQKGPCLETLEGEVLKHKCYEGKIFNKKLEDLNWSATLTQKDFGIFGRAPDIRIGHE